MIGLSLYRTFDIKQPMDVKWILAIALEAGFWMMLAAFLVLRYRYGIEGITRLFVIGAVLDTLGFSPSAPGTSRPPAT